MGSKILLLDEAEIARLGLAEAAKIHSAPGAKQKLRYTQAERNLFSAAVSITANHMAARIVAAYEKLEARIEALEKQRGEQ